VTLGSRIELTGQRTVRLIPTARLRPPALLPLANTPNDLAALAEIEGATSNRLIAQDRGQADLLARELVHGVPHAHVINAAFAYARPSGLNRFNGPGRGAWYAAQDRITCEREVTFHIERELAAIERFTTAIDYSEFFASFAGPFLDLVGLAPSPTCLDPDPKIGYPAGNLVAAQTRAEGLLGIRYPSLRHNGGICFVALTPYVVQAVAQGLVIRLTWTGTPGPRVEVVP